MAYKRLDLANGTKLDETHLKHIEDGISDNCSTNKLKLTIDRGTYNTSGDYSRTSYGKKYYRSSKYIHPLSNTITLNVSVDCQVRALLYNENFDFIETTEYQSCSANIDTTITLTKTNCKYLRFVFKKSDDTEFDLPTVFVNGVFPMEYFEKRPASGYQGLCISVNIPKLGTDSTEEWALKDSYEVLDDIGLLMLPTTYSNTGKPTRLIIWCHGAGGHYTTNSTNFPADTLDGSYWLSEGYAILDMNGYPYDTTTSHGFRPVASRCYESAYNWVITNYNIYTNGVLLGGRSMGGGTCLQLIQDTKIPFLAHCSIAGQYNLMQYWTKNVCPREQMAKIFNFSTDYPTWTTTGRCSEEEWNYLKANWKQAIQYMPFMKGIRGITDDNIDEFFDACYIDWNDKTTMTERDFCSKYLSFNMPVPSKLFAYYEDPTIPPERHAMVLQPMIQNNGQVCELRLFHTNATGSQAHVAELHDTRRNVQVTTIFGETVTASLIYVEILNFWRRYEKFV